MYIKEEHSYMNIGISPQDEIRQLEHQLETQRDERQRLILLDRLSYHYSFTNLTGAQSLLAEQQRLLRHYDFPDLLLNYHRYSAFVHNQLYQFAEAAQGYRKVIELVEERGDVQQQASAYIQYAGILINENQMDLAVDYLDKSRKLLKFFPDQRLDAWIKCREGYIDLHYANYSNAIEAFLEASNQIQGLEAELQFMDYYFLTLIHSGLGKVFERNNEWEKSVRAYLKVVNMCEKLGMNSRLSWHYLNVGSGFMALNDEESAERYFRKAINTENDISRLARASAYANLGYIKFQKKQYDQSLDLYDKAESLFKEVKADDYYNFSNIERWRAHLYLELGETDEAMDHFVEAYNHAKKVEDYKQISGIYRDIASFHADIGDYKSAYEYQVLHDRFAERYIEQVNSRKLMELEIKYEAEQKKRETELLQLKATRLQLKALRAQMNPHFMYNALNAIQHYITSNEIKNAAKYLAKFAQLMRQSLEYSELEIISLEKEIEFLKDYLTINQKLRFEDLLDFEIEVDDEIEDDILGVPTMIVQPYVENAIEHGLRSRKNGHILISFSMIDDHTILCVVEDNGIGREAARRLQENDPSIQEHKSRGTSITEKRLKLLHQSKGAGVFVKTLDLKDPISGEGKGTRVEIKIPIVEIQIK